MLNNNNNNKETTMHKCQICNDKPNEIFIGFLAKQGLKICKPCMSKHGDSHVIIDGEDNFIPTDYFNLVNNNKETTMPKSKWSKKTLSKVRKLADKHSVNVKNFSDDDLKEFLNLFVKATDKVNRERNNA